MSSFSFEGVKIYKSYLIPVNNRLNVISEINSQFYFIEPIELKKVNICVISCVIELVNDSPRKDVDEGEKHVCSRIEPLGTPA